MQHFIKWLGMKLFPPKRPPSPQPSQPRVRPRPPARIPAKPQAQRRVPSTPGAAVLDTTVSGRIEDGGPGKNVLVRSRYVREDTGTHETLKIIDDSIVEDQPEEVGSDPYNSGQFDRANNWNARRLK